MTITTTTSFTTAQGNGVVTAFNYNFLIPTAADVIVTLTDTTVTPNLETVLAPASYSITGLNNPAGGVVTYPLSGSPLIAGQYLSIQRQLPLTQEIDIENQGAFNLSVIESAFDYLTMIAQQQNDLLARAFTVPIGYETSPTNFLATIEGYMVGAQTAQTAAASSQTAAATSATASAGSASAASASATSAAASAATIITAVDPDCGYLNWVSATALNFIPTKGDRVKIAGTIYAIPFAGISIANTGVTIAGISGGVITHATGALAASTTYYVGLEIISSVLTPVFYPQSLFGHAPDTTAGNVGVEVLTNASGGAVFDQASLIGIVAINASSQFYNLGVASWFNPKSKYIANPLASTSSTTSSTLIELTTNLRVPFVTFGNRAPFIVLNAGGSLGTASSTPLVALGIDGAVAANIIEQVALALGANYNFNCIIPSKQILSEGSHYATLLCYNNGGDLTNFTAWSLAGLPAGTNLRVTIDG